MNIGQNRLRNNWIYILVILVVGFLSVGTYVTIIGLQHAEESSESFSDFYFEESKARVRHEVETRLNEIENERDNVMRYNLEAVEHEITHLAYILEHIPMEENQDVIQLRDMAVKEFEKMASFDKTHLYFAMNPEGVLLKSGTDERINGLDLIDAVDANGVYYTREIIKAKEHPDGIYVTYMWPKEKDGEPLIKTSFCYYIEKFDIIIGSGVYLEDIESELKERVYDSLQSYYNDRVDYLFITQFDGISQVTSTEENRGADLSLVMDSDGDYLLPQFMKIINNSGSGFITYTYQEKYSEVLSEKVSYIREIEGWDAFIGMGFHTDDLRQVSVNYTQDYKAQHYSEVAFIFISLSIVAFVVFLFVRRGIKLLRLYMKNEEGTFTQLIEMINEGVIIVNSHGLVDFYNKKANRYYDVELKGRFNFDQLNEDMVESKTYRIERGSDRTYYVEINEDQIAYKGEESTIYFIKNITKQYLKSNAFEQLSFVDELTRLPNRRALTNDYQELIGDMNVNDTMVAGIIDIDFFKRINDTYGHDFGDDILQLLAKVFLDRFRQTDRIYRYGGEEFVVLINNIDLVGAYNLLREVNETYSREAKSEYEVESTFSGGLIEFDGALAPSDLKTLISEMDVLLYEAKNNGRNRIEYKEKKAEEE